jgi:hypothetical protein
VSRRQLAGAAVLAALACAASAQDAQAPKLGAEPPPRAAQEQAPAQPVPVVVTICIDRSVVQCWTVSGASECRSPARPNAESFVTVGSGWPDAGNRLRECWAELTKKPDGD